MERFDDRVAAILAAEALGRFSEARQAIESLARGRSDEADLLENVPADEVYASDRCEACLVLAEHARITGDSEKERAHLESALATKAFASQAYVVALNRIRALDESEEDADGPLARTTIAR